MIKEFEDLTVWKKAHQLTLMIYQITAKFPPNERFGMISQIQRASISVESNIAEGAGRRTTKDYIGFLYQSLGSLFEVQSIMILGRDLNYIPETEYANLRNISEEVKKMLKKLISVLNNKPNPIQ